MADTLRRERHEAGEILDREWDPLGVCVGAAEEQAPQGE
jgi:hypothetical protein